MLQFPFPKVVWLAVLSVCLAASASAQNSVVTFVVNNQTTIPTRINDQRTTVGNLGYDISPVFAFVRNRDGQASWYQVPVGDCSAYALATAAYGINNLGMIVGTSECVANPGFLAYLRLTSGAIVNLTDPHGNVIPYDINDVGDIVGVVQNYAGFVRDVAGTTQYLSHGTTPVVPRAINNDGTVVGDAGSSAFVYQHGHLKFLNHKDQGTTFETHFLDINENGDILGYYVKSNQRHTFVLRHGHKVEEIVLPDLTFADAKAFDSEGDVIGTFGMDAPPFVGGFISYGLAK